MATQQRGSRPAGPRWPASGWPSAGRSPAAGEITLADGNQAGRGDLVRARLNTRIDADGQPLANRDTLRIDRAGRAPGPAPGVAVASGRPGRGSGRRRSPCPAAYLEENAELAYAGNVHVAQGRTVDAGHLVVEPGHDPRPGLRRRDPRAGRRTPSTW